MNIKTLSILVIIGVVIIGGIFIFARGDDGKTEGTLTSDEIGEKVISFVNNNILNGTAEATLIEVAEENGLYKVKFSIEDQEIETYATTDGKYLFPEAVDMTDIVEQAVEQGTTLGNFSISNEEVCQENGKPLVYFFGSETCPYCQWEHPVVLSVVSKFGDVISFHDNMNAGDKEMDIFEKYSTGGIPTVVIGCKYYRVGSGESSGEEGETNNLTALICDITGGQPNDVCAEVAEL